MLFVTRIVKERKTKLSAEICLKEKSLDLFHQLVSMAEREICQYTPCPRKKEVPFVFDVGLINFRRLLRYFYNAMLEDVTSSQSEYTFHHQLKTWLFNKSFHLILTAS